MAKRSNNSLGRRSYGGKPYDANNSFVKKMANKVGDLMPQRSWISKWFNTSEDNGEVDNENPEEGDAEEEVQPPVTKRPRIRMDVTHPPGTFSIHTRDRESAGDNHSGQERYSRINETGEDFLEPPVAGPSGVRSFVASTPAIPVDPRNSNSQRSELNSLIPSQNYMTKNRASNGVDDNSESSESTSGCSSLIPQTNRQEAPTNLPYNSNSLSRKREMIDEKLSFTNHLQSPRCLFLESGSRESLSSRRPSFNASIMSNTIDRSSSLSSPFYTGNVTFGGANAMSNYKPNRSLFNSTNEFQLKIPRRTSVNVKPSNNETVDSSGMSQTAKRILEAMEYFSSPVSDAKKIPVKNFIVTTSGRKRMRDEDFQGSTSRVGLRHLTRELSVPTVPDMLKLRRRQKLQDTTLAARKIVSATSGPPTGFVNRSNTVKSSVNYHLPTEKDENPKFHGKLRTKLKENFSTTDESPWPVNLPNITLPITSMPNFDPLPKYTKTTISEKKKNHFSVDPPRSRKTTFSPHNFQFASPIKIHQPSWCPKLINDFSFSVPLNAEDEKNHDFNGENRSEKIINVDSNFTSCVSIDLAKTNFKWPDSSTAPRLKVKTKPKKRENDSMTKETSELKSGSVMDVLGSKISVSNDASSQRSNSFPNFVAKLTPEIWECVDCYIKNDVKEKNCVACKASKPNVMGNKTSSENFTGSNNPAIARFSNETFDNQFKINGDQWKCLWCLVKNPSTELTCCSCSTPKPSDESSVPPSLKPISVTSVKSSLADTFKPAEGSWECPGCMLRNPSVVITCPCCKAAKPTSLKINPNKTIPMNDEKSNETPEKSLESKNFVFMDKFKPTASSWECSSCMVRNDVTTNSCVCCSTPKFTETSTKTSTMTKSTEQKFVTSGWGDKFKKPQGSWSCDSCLIQNKSDVNVCAACGCLKPGTTSKFVTTNFSFGVPSKEQSFNFGIDKTNDKPKSEVEQATSNGFTFVVKSANTSNDPTVKTFTFGMPKINDDSSKSTEIIGKSEGFVFAAPKNPDGVGGLKFEKKEKKFGQPETTENDEKKAVAKFSFGLPKTIDEKSNGSENKTIFGGPGLEPNGKPHFVFGDPRSDNKNAKTFFGSSSSDDSEQKTVGLSGETSSTNSNVKQPENIEVSTTKSNIPVTEQSSSTSTLSFKNSNLSSTTSTATITIQNNASFTFSNPTQKSEQSIGSCFDRSSSEIPSVSSNFPMTTPKPVVDVDNSPVSSPFVVIPASAASSSLAVTSTDAKTTSVFGTMDKKPSFFDTTGNEKNSSAFGAPEKKKPMFGATVNKLTTNFGTADNNKPVNSPMFNSPSSVFEAPSTVAAQPLFGNNSAASVFASGSLPSFGTSASTGETSSIFSAAKPSAASTTANPGIFTFGGNAAAAQPAASPSPAPATFNFTGNAATANTAGKSLFSFGGNNAAVASAAQSAECFASGGGFGTPASTNSPPSQFAFFATPKQEAPSNFSGGPGQIMFGAQPTAPSIGQTQPAQSASTGFNFGAAATPPTAGVFSFGGGMSQPASAPSSGFNFNAPSASPGIAFDPNTRPTFNFTGGSAPTAFNATPQPATTRKIKKAVRRMPQR